MGIPSTPNLSRLESAKCAPALRLVAKRDHGIRMPVDEAPADPQEGLGCARGVIIALGFQAVALILGVALWKLHLLFR